MAVLLEGFSERLPYYGGNRLPSLFKPSRAHHYSDQPGSAGWVVAAAPSNLQDRDVLCLGLAGLPILANLEANLVALTK